VEQQQKKIKLESELQMVRICSRTHIGGDKPSFKTKSSEFGLRHNSTRFLNEPQCFLLGFELKQSHFMAKMIYLGEISPSKRTLLYCFMSVLNT